MQQSLRSINEAIRASVAEFIGSLADNLTQVIKDCLSGFTFSIFGGNCVNNATVVQAVNTVNKAPSEVLVVKEKGISSSSRSRPALVLGNFKELTH